MLAKNYHVVLGVFRDESHAETRTPYQELFSHIHPEPNEVWPAGHQPVSLFGQPEQTRLWFDAFHERYLRNFTGRSSRPSAPKSHSRQALAGGKPCGASCGRRARFGTCPQCDGTGRIVRSAV
jgi:DnaJ-class molecular chaperone